MGNAEPPVTNEGPVIIDVPVDADLVKLGQVLHNGSKVPGKAGLGCDFDGFTGDIILTVHPGQGGAEITIAVNDECDLIVESLTRTTPQAIGTSGVTGKSGATDASSGTWYWEAWAFHRLRGEYDPDGDSAEDTEVQSVTEVEFWLIEDSDGFTLNSPDPRSVCLDTPWEIKGYGGCETSTVTDTSSSKRLKTPGYFIFHGTPKASWNQSAGYEANTSGIDRVICYSDISRPDFLKRTCRGDRTQQ